MTLKAHTLKQEAKPVEVSAVTVLMPEIEKLSESELADLRHEIDLRLQLDLGSLDLAEELALQFRQAKALLHDIQNAKDVAVNQKAQVYNAVRSQLSEIIRQQQLVWSTERLKKIETATVKAVNTLTEDARAIFFDVYGEYLKDPNAGA